MVVLKARLCAARLEFGTRIVGLARLVLISSAPEGQLSAQKEQPMHYRLHLLVWIVQR